MRKLVIAASIALLAACSTPQQEQLNLSPQATLSTNPLVQGKTYSLTSKDLRAAQYVALLDSGRSNILPLHAKQNMRILLESLLEQQFSSQGYKVDLNSNNLINLEVREALVNVRHSVMQNEMDAKVVLVVTAETPRGKLEKTYNGTAQRTGSLSASDEEIEMVLNDVLNLVMAEIANDQELQSYMKERF